MTQATAFNDSTVAPVSSAGMTNAVAKPAAQPAPSAGKRAESEPAPTSGARQSARRRLRSHRVRVDDFHLGQIEGELIHSSLGVAVGSVEDLSLRGLALVLPGRLGSRDLAHIGDRVRSLKLRCSSGDIYSGSAIVRRIADRGDDLVVGLETDSHGIDLGVLFRLGTRHSFQERLEALLDCEDTVTPQFKAWVATARAELEALKRFLDSEESGLGDLDEFSRREALDSYLKVIAPRVVERMNKASAELSALVEDLNDEQHRAYGAYFKSELLELVRHSPLLRRAYDKPLGYAGDYEMMNMLYREHAEGDSLFGKALNIYGAQEPAAQANINRITYLGRIIRATVEARGRARLASVGCGPAREIGALLEQSPELGSHLSVALIDQEERVINYCERTLSKTAAETGAQVDFIRESVRRLLTTQRLSEALGERDLIYSAGLFDYLNQRSFQALLGTLYAGLVPGGQLVVGNVSSDNPTRRFMEYCLDWFLIHRSRDDLLQFARELSPAPARIEVDAEPLGVNLFLRVWK